MALPSQPQGLLDREPSAEPTVAKVPNGCRQWVLVHGRSRGRAGADRWGVTSLVAGM
jgi:hypothetical protein